MFGDHDGNLHFVSRQMELTSFRAYEIRVSHLYQMKQHNVLVSVGVRLTYLIITLFVLYIIIVTAKTSNNPM